MVNNILPIFNGLLHVLMITILLCLSISDYRTFKIPSWTTACIGILGLIYMSLNPVSRMDGVFGFFSVSILLGLIYLLTKGRGIGGGDVKLMAVSGLMLGWQKNILAFFVGCVLVSFVYLFRRKFLEGQFGLSDSFHRLAFGPYLAAGIVVSMLWGEKIISAYVSWSGLMF